MNSVWESEYKSKQGNIGLGQAISYYMSQGYMVAIPINDTQPYDLIVDRFDGTGLKRVSVKTTRTKNRGKYLVDLRSSGGNKSRYINKDFDKSSCDIVFVYTIEDNIWEFPCEEINNSTAISLECQKYIKFKKK